jgi:acetyl-CoA C-acetyltransferase
LLRNILIRLNETSSRREIMERSVIVSAKRTPIGSFQGSLKTFTAPQLGSVALKAAVEKSGVEVGDLSAVLMGCVLTAGLGQAPARQAAIGAGIPQTVGAITINRVCSSGSQAVMLADLMIRTGEAKAVVAGGMESMTNSPYAIPGARAGLRLGDGKVVDTMIYDGLWDFYSDQHMGNCAESCAKEYGFGRGDQDEFAKMSYQRALAAIHSGAFNDEIVAVEVASKKGEPLIVDTDEEPGRVIFEKMPKLKASFAKDGTITAANASSISDGAAALIVTSESYAEDNCLKPLARIVSHAWHSQEPEWFTTAPIGAIKKALKKANLKPGDIDLWEINEAFSCVAMAARHEFDLDAEKVNIHGGAVALGHPIGCSGARLLTTLVHAMNDKGAQKGLATLCNGGGEATAIIVERIE